MKKNDFLVVTAMATAFTICAFGFVLLVYLAGGWFSELGVKRYDERPEPSLAPIPLTDQQVRHDESSSVCGGDQIYDRYYIDKPVSEVEAYYHQEMEKHCLARQGWQVTFTTMSCYGWDEIGTQDCRYASCVLRDELPSLLENFSVEIFEISPTKTFVLQNHGMHYLHTTPSKVQCGE